ncbi:unnamed protein product [Ostreobium quekettii]|uniref:Uncharacterized protein n=1 Tax=Ostreobium quekettii TaxID=121088 RepID=A0A8S1J5S3_9CHLO|nr:unnamed protein product [Ostreobium quekettii]
MTQTPVLVPSRTEHQNLYDTCAIKTGEFSSRRELQEVARAGQSGSGLQIRSAYADVDVQGGKNVDVRTPFGTVFVDGNVVVDTPLVGVQKNVGTKVLLKEGGEVVDAQVENGLVSVQVDEDSVEDGPAPPEGDGNNGGDEEEGFSVSIPGLVDVNVGDEGNVSVQVGSEVDPLVDVQVDEDGVSVEAPGGVLFNKTEEGIRVRVGDDGEILDLEIDGGKNVSVEAPFVTVQVDDSSVVVGGIADVEVEDGTVSVFVAGDESDSVVGVSVGGGGVGVTTPVVTVRAVDGEVDVDVPDESGYEVMTTEGGTVVKTGDGAQLVSVMAASGNVSVEVGDGGSLVDVEILSAGASTVQVAAA